MNWRTRTATLSPQRMERRSTSKTLLPAATAIAFGAMYLKPLISRSKARRANDPKVILNDGYLNKQLDINKGTNKGRYQKSRTSSPGLFRAGLQALPVFSPMRYVLLLDRRECSVIEYSHCLIWLLLRSQMVNKSMHSVEAPGSRSEWQDPNS